jgi:hypothetical protein
MSIMDSPGGYFNLRDANDAAKAAAYQNAPKINPYMQAQIPQAPGAPQAPRPPVAGGPLGGPSWKKGGKVKSSKASKRADDIAQRGKTKGRFV